MSKIEYPDMPPRAKTRKFFDKKTTFFSVVGLVMFLILVVLDFRRAIPPSQGQPEATTPQTSMTGFPGETWTPAHQRAYAQKLASKGLKKEAVTAFRQYLASPAIPLSELANVNYTMGKMLFDMADYEPALSAFYQAELAGASGDLKQTVTAASQGAVAATSAYADMAEHPNAYQLHAKGFKLLERGKVGSATPS